MWLIVMYTQGEFTGESNHLTNTHLRSPECITLTRTLQFHVNKMSVPPFDLRLGVEHPVSPITGNCILQLWKFRGALRACKCPICTCFITKLTPKASLFSQQEKEVVDLLKGIHRYNRLYEGGMRGIALVCFLRKTPLFLRSVLWALMDMLLDPHQLRLNYNMMRFVALLVGWIYSKCHMDFIPTGRLGIYAVLDTCAVFFVALLFSIGLYRKWLRGRRVRRFAMEQQAVGID
ncbi:hypothetical protein DM860_003093 [Cuscuta australis]|uniref:Uncharacterized protein n=1 Tax=Cuscuta australis TaxID=267555 RepID=A0A328D3A3_9ASTE|nr:hypothetical protein DM860_003093 [Cuscuta australis]